MSTIFLAVLYTLGIVLFIAVPIALIVLLIVTKKGFVIPLLAGIGFLAGGIYMFLDARDHLEGFVNNMLTFVSGDYEKFLQQKNIGIVLIVVGAILTLLGIIFGIMSGIRASKKDRTAAPGPGYTGGNTAPMTCARCGRKLPAGTKFCPICGTSVMPQSAQQAPQNNMPPTGQNVGSQGVQNGPAPQSNVPPTGQNVGNQGVQNGPVPQSNVPPAKHICPSCGAENKGDRNFCGSCGAKLS